MSKNAKEILNAVAKASSDVMARSEQDTKNYCPNCGHGLKDSESVNEGQDDIAEEQE